MPARNSIKQYIENGYYHIYNRGVEKRLIFLDEQDYSVFLSYLKEYLLPKNESELSIGDIISYKLGKNVIVHRIMTIEYDTTGWYTLTKGDNNKIVDPDKVRFEQIEGKIVVLIY